ncbi:hypothetical protein PLUTE_a3864 [Pseudoalteromonas luteoviolacea DSM 6061]|nr:hypothetical protein [Pseudoalteromonas luteoviolacea DSM 6061]
MVNQLSCTYILALIFIIYFQQAMTLFASTPTPKPLHSLNT